MATWSEAGDEVWQGKELATLLYNAMTHNGTSLTRWPLAHILSMRLYLLFWFFHVVTKFVFFKLGAAIRVLF